MHIRLITSVILAVVSVSGVAEDGINAALLYHNYCSVCHGDKGDGQSRANQALQPPPRDFTAEAMRSVLTRERIVHAIAEGRPRTAMVGWKSQLKPAEIEALTDFLLDNFINPRVDPQLEAGQRLYAENCSVCHGDQGTGGRWTQGLKYRPRDFTSERARLLSREAMIDAVTHGRPGTPMAAFAGQLNGEQIARVVDFIRVKFMAEPMAIEGLSGTYAHGRATETPKPMADLKGDGGRGRDFYMANCFTCHGVNGDGNGPRAYFINPKPANFLAERYRKRLPDRDAVFVAIRDGKLGTEMPAWGKVIDDQLIADLTEFVYSEFVSADPIQNVSQGKKND